MIALLLAATFGLNREALLDPGSAANFYAVVPHAVLVALFGSVGLFVLTALAVGIARCWRDLASTRSSARPPHRNAARPARRSTTFSRYGTCTWTAWPASRRRRCARRGGASSTTRQPTVFCCASPRPAWRRFITSAVRWRLTTTRACRWCSARSAASVSLVGPAGLLAQRRHRDPALSDPAQERLDGAFLVLLLLTGATGLLLLALRSEPFMGILLIVHLGVVLALFLTLPYGKFVHGLYRAAALLKYRREEAP